LVIIASNGPLRGRPDRPNNSCQNQAYNVLY
jgi:hypothetical protein